MILLSHVLQSLPIYLLSTMNPPKCVIEQIHQAFAKFFWVGSSLDKKKHRVTWDELCFPKEVLGFRYVHEITRALFAKLWWNFRTSVVSYMGNKYCKKDAPCLYSECRCITCLEKNHSHNGGSGAFYMVAEEGWKF